MFLKLLLTILVIGGALIYVRRRNQRALLQQPASPRSLPSEPQRSSLVKVAAVVSVVLMLLGAVGYLYFQWQDNYQVVDLRVVDTRSGNEKHYQAYKGDVEARGFVSTDGLRVSLAEVERMEVGGGR